MLPELTPLQYLVLHSLQVGPQDAVSLRRSLRAVGVRQSAAAFHGLMARMAMNHHVEIRQRQKKKQGQIVHCHQFTITDLGLLAWTEACRFYQALPPPSPDVAPVATEEGRLAAYDRKTRKEAIQKDFDHDVKQLTKALKTITLGMIRQKNESL